MKEEDVKENLGEFIGIFLDAEKHIVRCYREVGDNGMLLFNLESMEGKIILDEYSYAQVDIIVDICFGEGWRDEPREEPRNVESIPK